MKKTVARVSSKKPDDVNKKVTVTVHPALYQKMCVAAVERNVTLTEWMRLAFVQRLK